MLRIMHKDVTQKFAKLASRFEALRPWLFEIEGILRKIWQVQIERQLSSVGMRIGPHTPIALRCQRRQLR